MFARVGGFCLFVWLFFFLSCDRLIPGASPHFPRSLQTCSSASQIATCKLKTRGLLRRLRGGLGVVVSSDREVSLSAAITTTRLAIDAPPERRRSEADSRAGSAGAGDQVRGAGCRVATAGTCGASLGMTGAWSDVRRHSHPALLRVPLRQTFRHSCRAPEAHARRNFLLLRHELTGTAGMRPREGWLRRLPRRRGAGCFWWRASSGHYDASPTPALTCAPGEGEAAVGLRVLGGSPGVRGAPRSARGVGSLFRGVLAPRVG